MTIRLIRHATLWLDYGGRTLLVDPMLSEAGANPPVAGTANDRRNPLVPLPPSAPVESLANPDLVLVTHLHTDHWDTAADDLLPIDVPLLCQPGDEDRLREAGRTAVIPVVDAWYAPATASASPGSGRGRHPGLSVTRTGGRHGTGAIGQAMGQVSGFVLRAPGEPVVYIAGDTIYCREVEEALQRHAPDVVIVNAGGARFLTGGPITMTADDVAEVCRRAPQADVIAVHLEAVNHCLETRDKLRSRLERAGLAGRVRVPADGDWL